MQQRTLDRMQRRDLFVLPFLAAGASLPIAAATRGAANAYDVRPRWLNSLSAAMCVCVA